MKTLIPAGIRVFSYAYETSIPNSRNAYCCVLDCTHGYAGYAADSIISPGAAR
jgi:hypothetical protein